MRTWLTKAAGGALVALLAVGSLPAASEPAAQTAPLEHGSFDETTLWDSTTDPHVSYHVHGIAVLPDDTILAVTEGRHEVCDAGPRDLVMRRSVDGGDTWQPSAVVVPADDGASWGNPSLLVDDETGKVFLFYMQSFRDEGNTTCSGDRGDVYVIDSDDGGVTWSEPRSLAHLFAENDYGWTLHAPGPGHGIQLADGRLLMQAFHRREVIGHSVTERLYGAAMIYSDDHGETWHASEAVPVSASYPINENRVYQRADGAVVTNGRWAAGGFRHRITSVSTDNGTTWSNPVIDGATGEFVAVDAGLVRHSGGPGSDEVDRLLYSRPDAASRRNMTVSISYDEGSSYRYSRVVNEGPSYYSDLAVLSDGTILLLYGRDGDHAGFPERVSLARFDLAWLTQGRDSEEHGPGLVEYDHELGRTSGVRTGPSRPPAGDPGLVTPDVSGHDRHGEVVGAPEVVDGMVGSALGLAAGDHVEVPWSPGLGTGGRDFTAAAWFRTDATSSQAILWAYGLGSGVPQWWIRLEPGSNRIRALIDTDASAGSLVAPGSYADGEWHHVALTRDAVGLTLYVDGVAMAHRDGVAGSVSVGANTGVHVGQRPDGANPLTGAVDEVRLFDHALSAHEIAALSEAGDAGGDTLVRLPLDAVEPAAAGPRLVPTVVADDNARGGATMTFEAQLPGDYVEIPVRVDRAGEYEVAVRYERSWDHGYVRVSLAGIDLAGSPLDPSLTSAEGYQVYSHGQVELRAGIQWLRFTLVRPGAPNGGTVIRPDHLSLVRGD